MRPGPNPIKNFQHQVLLYAGIRPIREAIIGHLTDVIGLIQVCNFKFYAKFYL